MTGNDRSVEERRPRRAHARLAYYPCCSSVCCGLRRFSTQGRHPRHRSATGSRRVQPERDAARARQFNRVMGLWVRADFGRLGDATHRSRRCRWARVLGRCDRDGVVGAADTLIAMRSWLPGRGYYIRPPRRDHDGLQAGPQPRNLDPSDGVFAGVSRRLGSGALADHSNVDSRSCLRPLALASAACCSSAARCAAASPAAYRA